MSGLKFVQSLLWQIIPLQGLNRLAIGTQDHIILLRKQTLDFLAADGKEFPHSGHAGAGVLGCNRGCLKFVHL